MSQQDAERFAKDLKANPKLLADLRKTAGGLGLAGVCEFAKKKGYGISVDDAKTYVRSKANKELSDDQLDRIAGGKGGPSDTNVTQTTSAGPAAIVAMGAPEMAVAQATVAGVVVVT